MPSGGRVVGAVELRARLLRIAASAPQIIESPPIKSLLLKRVKQRFMEETSPDGERWAELSPNTLDGPGILRKTEHLYRAISVLEGKPGSAFGSATGAGFRIGVKSSPWVNTFGKSSRVEDPAHYGRFHQTGTRNMPKRRFLGISDKDAKAITAAVRRRLKAEVEL